MRKLATPNLLTTDHAIQDMKRRDLARCEAMLPQFMMLLMSEECMKKGWQFRLDFHAHLKNATLIPLKDQDELTISRTVKRVDDCARSLLHDLSPDDPRDGLAVTAMFVLLLVDQGFIVDTRSQAVLGALHYIEDIKDEGGEFGFNEASLKTRAGAMLLRSNFLGFYLRPPVLTPVMPSGFNER